LIREQKPKLEPEERRGVEQEGVSDTVEYRPKSARLTLHHDRKTLTESPREIF
jgi:hypothetical protein